LQKGSFYHYFASKDAILREGLIQTGAYFQEHVFAIAYNDAVQPKKRMKSMLEKHIAIMLRECGGCLVANIAAEALSTNPEIKPLLLQVSNNWFAAVRHILLTQHPLTSAESLAWQIIQDVEGAIMLTRLYDNEVFLKQALKRSVGYCMQEVKNKSRS
jgi:TetR/AcrR family transcriptional repressor of nem operon